jgi:hypothetical protein
MLLTEHRRAVSTQPAATAAAQLRAWVESEEGQHVWLSVCPLPSIERVCHALDTTHARIYGLLIAPDFFTIFSTLPHQAFTRLADRYQTAAQTGLCFWWDGCTLRLCGHSDVFFAHLRTLPPPVPVQRLTYQIHPAQWRPKIDQIALVLSPHSG